MEMRQRGGVQELWRGHPDIALALWRGNVWMFDIRLGLHYPAGPFPVVTSVEILNAFPRCAQTGGGAGF